MRAGCRAELPAKTAQFTGEETDPATKLFQIRNGLQADGFLSSGLEGEPHSRPGHSAERLNTLVAEEEMVGDDEQFAVALALMARQAGIPARVVMGFYPDKQSEYEEGKPWSVLGSDVHAWIEVPFEEYGWVPIDAVPEEKPQVQPQPESKEEPKPPVLQDPEPPEEPDHAKAGSVEDDEKEEAENDGFDWGLFGMILLAVGIPLLVIAGPIVAILAYKARRRTARRNAEQPADRISGGWHEVVDVVTDLGTSVPRGATRRESAGVIAGAHAVPSTLMLAHRADATVFGLEEPTPADVEAFWVEVDELVGGLRSTVGKRQRVRAALSLRSIWVRVAERRRAQAVARATGTTKEKSMTAVVCAGCGVSQQEGAPFCAACGRAFPRTGLPVAEPSQAPRGQVQQAAADAQARMSGGSGGVPLVGAGHRSPRRSRCTRPRRSRARAWCRSSSSRRPTRASASDSWPC